MQIAVDHGQVHPSDAEIYVNGLKAKGRYVEVTLG